MSAQARLSLSSFPPHNNALRHSSRRVDTAKTKQYHHTVQFIVCSGAFSQIAWCSSTNGNTTARINVQVQFDLISVLRLMLYWLGLVTKSTWLGLVKDHVLALSIWFWHHKHILSKIFSGFMLTNDETPAQTSVSCSVVVWHIFSGVTLTDVDMLLPIVVENIQWFHANKCWDTISNSGLSLCGHLNACSKY